MTTGWLLLLLLIVSSQGVDETHGDGEQWNKQQRNSEGIGLLNKDHREKRLGKL